MRIEHKLTREGNTSLNLKGPQMIQMPNQLRTRKANNPDYMDETDISQLQKALPTGAVIEKLITRYGKEIPVINGKPKNSITSLNDALDKIREHEKSNTKDEKMSEGLRISDKLPSNAFQSENINMSAMRRTIKKMVGDKNLQIAVCNDNTLFRFDMEEDRWIKLEDLVSPPIPQD